MDRVPTPRELHGAAAVARTLAYVVGVAGVVAGALVYRDGEVALGVVVWVVTFAAGAVLMITSLLVAGLAALLARTAALESDVRVLLGRGRADRTDTPDDPWADHPNPW